MRTALVALGVALGCNSPQRASPSPVALPARQFFIADVLGRHATDLGLVLGDGTPTDDGIVVYHAFDPTRVSVLFDNDRAAMVSVAPPRYAASDADVERVLAWMHAARARFHVETRGAVEVWSPPMARRQLARNVAAWTLGALARGVVLELGAPCDEARLGALAARPSPDVKQLGFAKLACAGGAALVVR